MSNYLYLEVDKFISALPVFNDFEDFGLKNDMEPTDNMNSRTYWFGNDTYGNNAVSVYVYLTDSGKASNYTKQSTGFSKPSPPREEFKLISNNPQEDALLKGESGENHVAISE